MKAVVEIQIPGLERGASGQERGDRSPPCRKGISRTKGYDPVYGGGVAQEAHPEGGPDALALKFLEGEFGEGDRVLIDYRDGRLVLKRTAAPRASTEQRSIGAAGRPESGLQPVCFLDKCLIIK
ncbi:MAG: hypothetical protein M5U19_07760 [Microthrixaceae bacterium]|nr:hypothetical protein [Microthrixaceae bacterium]